MFTRRLLLGISLCAASVLSATSVASAATPQPPLSVLGSTPLSISGTKGEDVVEAKFTLLNAGDAAAKISIGFQATSSEAVKVVSWSPEEVPADAAQRISVQFSGLEDLTEAVTGQLVVTGGEAPVAQSIEIAPPPPDTSWPAILIFGSLAATFLVAMFVIGAMRGQRSRLWKAAPNPKWSFSSWATTLTAAGALLGTVLGQATFPTVPDKISKAELVNLNIFFALVLVVGPFLFEALRVFRPEEAKNGRTGNNLTVLIACGFTVWAVIGQLGSFGLLGWELLGGGNAGRLGAIATGIFVILALWYFFTTASETVVRDWKKEEEEAKKAAEEAQCCPKPAAASSWSLL
jgi:hypothetical protein